MSIKRFDDYESIRGYGKKSTILPRGGYVITIKEVRQAENSVGKYLRMYYDVAEGPQKDFYKKNYETQDSEDRRWKGLFFVNEPTDDGTAQDYYRKRNFKTMTEAFENSNPGYIFDWDEKSFIGLKVGIVVNHKEKEFNSRTAMVVNVARICSVDEIRTGDYTVPADILLKKKLKISETDENGFMKVNEEELPF